MFGISLGATRAADPGLAPNQLNGEKAGINRRLVLRILIYNVVIWQYISCGVVVRSFL